MPTQRGINTSHSEVTAIGATGFWLLVDDREYFVPFRDYPAFHWATVDQVFQYVRIAPDQFHWSDLDIDIELDALAYPERYPLVWS